MKQDTNKNSMIQSLRDRQVELGAIVGSVVGETADLNAPLTFGNDAEAIAAAKSAIAIYDQSHWGRIRVAGNDRLRFLHNQSTNDFQQLKPGQGCQTVFVTSTARTIDLATAYVLEDSVLLLVSPNRCKSLMQWMDRYIFFADQVELHNVTESTVTFSLMGNAGRSLLEKLGATDILDAPIDHHQLLDLDGIAVRVAVGSGLAIAGYTLTTEAENGATLWTTLTTLGAVPLGETAWQRLRIEQGRPAPDAELTEEFNPLEAGLWNTISLQKGCYIGQETIARLHTYRGVKQQLWGVKLTQAVEPEAIVWSGEEKIGKLTSCTPTEDGFLGLAYIRSKAAESGLKIQVGEAQGELVAVPFVSHDYL